MGKRTPTERFRYLGLDISLSSSGFAVIDVTDGKPMLVIASHVKTDAKQTDGLRFSLIDAFATLISASNQPFTAIIREDYKRPASKRQGQALFGAWAAIDSGLNRCGLAVTNEINASTVKLVVGGHGKAEKSEVATGAKRLLRLPADYVFATDDESDACAVVLAFLIGEGLIA
jgi:crossover junction endodeoxyribonuclease RuvC